MLPFPIDIIGFASFYFLMKQLYALVIQSNTHSFTMRLLSSLIAYCIVYFLFDYCLNVVLITVDFYTDAQYSTAYEWIGITLLTGLLIQWYTMRPQELNSSSIKDFIVGSLYFKHYFRLTDVDTQEKIGTHNMKTLYEEVHGKPFTDDLLATSFDQHVTKFKKVSLEELQKKEKRYPPEYFEEIVKLKANQTTDISVSFRFQLLNNTIHPLFKLMQHFEIDPVARRLTIRVLYPEEVIISLQTSFQQIRLVEQTYEALQILISEDWFALYVPYFREVTVTCNQKEITEMMTESIRPLMSMSIPYRDLKLGADRITTGSAIKKIAQIQFF